MPAALKSAILLMPLLRSCVCIAQIEPPPKPEVPPAADWTSWQGTHDSVQIRARLRDVSQYSARHTAVVEVEVQNIWLNPPVQGSPGGARQGILRYQLDRCPPVVTTDTRLRFDQLSPGQHTISIGVIGLDNRLLTPFAILHVKIP